MGINRSSLYKCRKTGGAVSVWKKKRKCLLGRQSSLTKLGPRKSKEIRVRGGNIKTRLIRADHGQFSWSSERKYWMLFRLTGETGGVTFRSKIYGTSYSPTNNEFVRTNTLVKGTIIAIDASPFKNYYLNQYGRALGKTRASDEVKEFTDEQKESHKRHAKYDMLEPHVEVEFETGKLLARITSRPGQIGNICGYILEGEELEFYKKKIDKKKKSSGSTVLTEKKKKPSPPVVASK